MKMARSFFDAYRDLFEYSKHVGEEDPVVLSQRDGIGAKTFLDKYRECEQRQARELRANVSTLAIDTAMLTHAPQQLFQYFSVTTTPQSFASLSLHGAAGAQQQQPDAHLFHQNAPIPPSLTRSRLENSLRQSAISSSTNNQEEVATTAFSSHYSLHATPERASPTKADPLDSAPLALDLQQPGTARIASHSRTAYQLPKLSSLLVDSSTRSSTLRHRHLDEAKKIELLIGSNCGGRISSASTNLPPSIRRRLQASAKVEQRRERLYAILCQHYQSICMPAHLTDQR